MKTENSPISSPTKSSFGGENGWFLLFFGLAILGGIVVAFVGREYGWLSLLALPTLLIAAAILFQPEWALAAFAVVIYIQLNRVISLYHTEIPFFLSPAYPLLGILVFIVVWRIFIQKDRPSGLKRASVVFILMIFWLFSAIIADDPAHGLIKFRKYAENSLFVFIFVFFIQKPESLKRVIWSLIAAGAFLATITVFQNLTSTFSSVYGGFGQWEYASTAGVTNYRAAGTYGNANAYAQSLIMLIPLALDRFWQAKKPTTWLIAGWALVFCILAIIYSFSRNGFISLLFTLGFLLAIRRPNILPLAITGFLVLLMLQLLPVSYLDRITTIFEFSSATSPVQVVDQSFRGRLSENLAAWQMFRDNPLFGVGLDNFEINYQDYSRKIGLDPRRGTRAPASFYLELLSEQGLIGTVVFMVFIVMVFRSLWRARRIFSSLRMFDEASLTLAFFAGLLGYMFFYISKSGSYSNAFWILLGIALSIEQVAENYQATGDNPTSLIGLSNQ